MGRKVRKRKNLFRFFFLFPAPEFFPPPPQISALLGETDSLIIYLFIYPLIYVPTAPSCSIFLAAEGIQFRLLCLAPWCTRNYKLQIQLIVFQKGGFFFSPPLNMNPNGLERYVQV